MLIILVPNYTPGGQIVHRQMEWQTINVITSIDSHWHCMRVNICPLICDGVRDLFRDSGTGDFNPLQPLTRSMSVIEKGGREMASLNK